MSSHWRNSCEVPSPVLTRPSQYPSQSSRPSSEVSTTVLSLADGKPSGENVLELTQQAVVAGCRQVGLAAQPCSQSLWFPAWSAAGLHSFLQGGRVLLPHSSFLSRARPTLFPPIFFQEGKLGAGSGKLWGGILSQFQFSAFHFCSLQEARTASSLSPGLAATCWKTWATGRPISRIGGIWQKKWFASYLPCKLTSGQRPQDKSVSCDPVGKRAWLSAGSFWKMGSVFKIVNHFLLPKETKLEEMRI